MLNLMMLVMKMIGLPGHKMSCLCCISGEVLIKIFEVMMRMVVMKALVSHGRFFWGVRAALVPLYIRKRSCISKGLARRTSKRCNKSDK